MLSIGLSFFRRLWMTTTDGCAGSLGRDRQGLYLIEDDAPFEHGRTRRAKTFRVADGAVGVVVAHADVAARRSARDRGVCRRDRWRACHRSARSTPSVPRVFQPARCLCSGTCRGQPAPTAPARVSPRAPPARPARDGIGQPRRNRQQRGQHSTVPDAESAGVKAESSSSYETLSRARLVHLHAETPHLISAGCPPGDPTTRSAGSPSSIAG